MKLRSKTSAKSDALAPDEVWATLKRVLSENLYAYRWQYAFAGACLLVVSGATAFIPWVMRPLIDEVFYRENYAMVLPICLTIIVVFLARGFAHYGQAVTLARIGNNLAARYQQRIFAHLMMLGLDFYADNRSGQLAARINENVLGIREMLAGTLKSIVGDSVLLIALIGAMIALDPLLSGMALLIGPPLIIAVNYVMRRLRSVARQSVEVNARLVGAMQEATQGIAVVKAFTMERQLADKLAAVIALSEDRANKIARVSERITPISEILAGFAISGVVAYAAYRTSTSAEPPGSVFAFITALLLAYDPARRLARVQVNLSRALVNARMIYEILDIVPGEADRPDAPALAVSSGAVRFEDVTFGYGHGLPVLHGVTLSAEPGRTTAIVGASGAGKSTLLALLQRFHDVDDGAILIDGQDIASVSKASLRGQMAFVSQQAYLFEGSVRDNIRYGRPEASDAEIEAAARMANADAFIRTLPQSYETLLGENGQSLSGGQRQRLSIARAIVRNAPILLLDEATSALDNESEALVQQALQQIMKGRTTIVIAHRLSTIVNADKIVVMEAGRVVEEGRHDDLVARPSGIYARFYSLQGPSIAAEGGKLKRKVT